MLQKHYYYSSYRVGQIIPEEKGTPDKCVFDVYDGGAVFFMTLDCPTRDELKQMASKKKEIRLSCMADILWFTLKFGDLEWCEGPYNPHLSKQAHFPDALRTCCDSIEIILVDSSNGMVKYSERFPLSEALSAAMKTGIMLLLAQEFDQGAYDSLMAFVKSKYTAKQIADNAIVKCSL